MTRVAVITSALFVASTAWLGCSGAAARDDAPKPTGADQDAPRGFDGIITPAHATKLYAPANEFSVAGWHNMSGWTKLASLVADGTAVKAGDVVATFELRQKSDVEQMLRRRRNEVEARVSESTIRMQERARVLDAESGRRRVEAEMTAIDLLRAPAVSVRDQKLLGIRDRLARFEADAAEQTLAAHRREAAGTDRYGHEDLARMAFSEAQLEHYVHRFELRAPRDGFVRHAFNAHDHRTFQQGDGMASGTQVLSVADDQDIAVRFFVPEAEFATVRVGQTVVVVSASTEDRYSARVTTIEPFPQEIGSLREDGELPNAREKAYAVIGAFDAGFSALGGGNEVKVRLP